MAQRRTTARNHEDLRSMINIGKTTAEKLKQIGVTTTSEFMSRDPYEVFDELRTKVDPTLCRCALASIVGAHLGVTWHRITRQSAAEYERRHPGHKWDGC